MCEIKIMFCSGTAFRTPSHPLSHLLREISLMCSVSHTRIEDTCTDPDRRLWTGLTLQCNWLIRADPKSSLVKRPISLSLMRKQNQRQNTA